jgi:hypothetical protein
MQEAMPKAKKLNHEEHEETRRKTREFKSQNITTINSFKSEIQKGRTQHSIAPVLQYSGFLPKPATRNSLLQHSNPESSM